MPIESLSGGPAAWRLFPVRRRWCLALAAAIVLLLFYLGSLPIAVGLFPDPWDKLAHFALFGAIAGLLWLGLGGQAALGVVGAVAVIGALDEWHQASLPGRSADYTDFLTDVIAASLAVLVLQAWQRWQKGPSGHVDRNRFPGK